MACFCPKDTIFLLNKWDTILDDERDDLFENTKAQLQTIWKTIDVRRILRLAAGRVRTHNLLFCHKQPL